jgi:hypothetical protein
MWDGIFKLLKVSRNWFQVIDSAGLNSSLAGRYDNPIPTRFLAPIDCSKIPAQLGNRVVVSMGEVILQKSSEQIFKDDVNGVSSTSDICFRI